MQVAKTDAAAQTASETKQQSNFTSEENSMMLLIRQNELTDEMDSL